MIFLRFRTQNSKTGTLYFLVILRNIVITYKPINSMYNICHKIDLYINNT